MTRFRVLLAILLIGSFAACSQQSTAPDPVTDTSGATTELPAEVSRAVDEYVVQNEDVLLSLNTWTDPNLTDTLWDGYDVYAVTFLWGSFFPLGPNTNPIDWTGQTSINANAFMRLITAISFESGEDEILPSTTPASIAWASFTRNDLDGVTFFLFHDRNTVYVTPPVLTFDTDPITFDVPLADLDHYAAFYPVDGHSGVVAIAKRIRRYSCPHGYLGGEWEFDANDHTRGTFAGRWFARSHQAVGLIAGRFWTDGNGARMMAGEVSGIDTDEVILELEGRWYLSPHLSNAVCLACPDIGHFQGRWRYVDGSGEGRYAGVFGDPTLATDMAQLPFRGVWRQHCDNVGDLWTDISD